jgi:hypothetical protein
MRRPPARTLHDLRVLLRALATSASAVDVLIALAAENGCLPEVQQEAQQAMNCVEQLHRALAVKRAETENYHSDGKTLH